MVTTVQLATDVPAAVKVEAVRFRSDRGVAVDYLGYTTCKRGCVGSGPLDAEAQRLIDRGREGLLPIPIRSGHQETLSLILLVRLTDEGRQLLSDKGCLGVRAVLLRVQGGREVIASSPMAYVAVLEAGQESRCITRRN
ncbi:MAG: hypothetical protein WDA27_01995 [Actinomycetota bacterium]